MSSFFNQPSFFDGPLGKIYSPVDVEVVHRPGTPSESRTTVRAAVLKDTAYFDVNAPVYEGDLIVAPDPRGGERTYVVLDYSSSSGIAVEGLSYGMAKLRDAAKPASPPSAPAPAQTVYNGPVIQVSGGHSNIAWNGATVIDQSSTSPVASGYDTIAEAVVNALRVLSEHAQLFDRDEALEATKIANDALHELSEPEPDRRRLAGLFTFLRGVLTSATGSAIGGTIAGIVKGLVL